MISTAEYQELFREITNDPALKLLTKSYNNTESLTDPLNSKNEETNKETDKETNKDKSVLTFQEMGNSVIKSAIQFFQPNS
jgi:hypothetical protein